MSEPALGNVLRRLAEEKIEFILVGGLAAVVHGTSRATFDVDVVYRRTPENIQRLVDGLSRVSPYLRGAPPGLPFRLDLRTMQAGLNFTLTTSIGDLDLLGEVTGGGDYDSLLPFAETVTVFGLPIHCVGLEKLIDLKRAAGRPKDLEVIAELTALLEERRRSNEGS